MYRIPPNVYAQKTAFVRIQFPQSIFEKNNKLSSYETFTIAKDCKNSSFISKIVFHKIDVSNIGIYFINLHSSGFSERSTGGQSAIFEVVALLVVLKYFFAIDCGKLLTRQEFIIFFSVGADNC